jgi:hypothetical protein
VPNANVWDEVLTQIRSGIADDDFRRWFGDTGYAGDVGDQISVWVTSEAIRRHLATHYDDNIRKALVAIGRPDAHVRFIVGGYDDEEEDEEALP